MATVILIIHLLLALGLVGIILIQRSEGGGLGIGGGGGMSGFMTSRGSANFLTRTTAILATCFIITSLLLAYISKQEHRPQSILEAEEIPDFDSDEGFDDPLSTPSIPETPNQPEVPLE